jgi:enterochelin esterase family protein
MIGIFVNPGVVPPLTPDAKPRKNRSSEYDSLGDQYARFLLEELLPPIAQRYRISTNPGDRAICGISSGGICAWTVAWERPDQFGKVLSHVGSFTNIRGSDDCHALIRKTEKSQYACFFRKAKTIWTICTAIGLWLIARWRRHSSSRGMSINW